MEAAVPNDHSTMSSMQFICEYGFEWDAKCIDELKLVVGGPKHIFRDVRGVVPSKFRASCGLDGHLMPNIADVYC